ncbi:MAG TPA: nucleoside 2-deoxyribosyltransferase [Xanthomonadaceae bacterium]|jgi:nucleoside 2-deoxyribosyltransferase
MNKPWLYLAAPLFNPQELAFNGRLASSLESRFNVFMPQRDGVLIPGKDLSSTQFREMSESAFRSDLFAIRNAEVVLAVLDGRTIDEGVAFELGYATALGKLCIGLKTDNRVLLANGINPMVSGSLHELLASETDVQNWTSRYFANTGKRDF